MNLEVIPERLAALLAGLPLTLQLVGLSLVIGFVLACGLAACRLSSSRILSGLAYAYVYVVRGTPLLVQLFAIYYGLGMIDLVRESPAWPVLREEFACAVMALSLNSAAYASEVIRGGVLSIGHGQIEAAKAFGMGRLQRVWRIVVPQVVRQAAPAYGNELISITKASALASTIAVMEVTGLARNLASQTYTPIETFTAAGLIYLTINFAITLVIRGVERRYRIP